jgi:hypothetical protein
MSPPARPVGKSFAVENGSLSRHPMGPDVILKSKSKRLVRNPTAGLRLNTLFNNSLHAESPFDEHELFEARRQLLSEQVHPPRRSSNSSCSLTASPILNILGHTLQPASAS